MEWSKYQQEIFRYVKEEKGSAVIIAVAGSGKQTTILESCKIVPSDRKVSFVAFNKSIAEELKKRVPSHVSAGTLHSMGYKALASCYSRRPSFRMDSRKTSWLMDDNMSPAAVKLYGSGVRQLVALAKAHGILPKRIDGIGLTHDTEQNWSDIIDKYDIDFEGNAKPEEAITFAREILELSIDVARRKMLIDFDDMLYLPVIWQASFDKQDVVFCDESQDVNQVQRAMLRVALRMGGRLIAVGDPWQSIYGFRGADTEAIENIKQEFSAVELPLSVSYRCPKLVVEEARKYVTHIEPSETAIEGKVTMVQDFNETLFESTDAIVCRNTAPVITMAYKLIRKQKPCRVLGREIGEGLVALIKKMNAASVDELEEKLEKYREREGEKLMAKKQEQRAEAVNDKVDTIGIFIENLPEDNRTVAKLSESITNLFTDNDQGRLTLCTVHKAKGLEWKRVFILNRELMP